MMLLKKMVFVYALMVLFILSAAETATNNDPSAYWSLDEGVGNIANDKSGNGNAGKIHGAVKWVDGRDGRKALLFDGKTTYIDCGNPKSLNPGDKISIEAWIKPDSCKGGGIVHKYLPDSGYFLTAAWRDNQQPYFFVRNKSSASFLKEKALKSGKWYHVLATAEQNGKMRLYIDGYLLQEKKVPHSFENNNGNLIIGKYGEDCFSGLISDLKIYNRIIVPSEIPILQDHLEKNKKKIADIEKRYRELKDIFKKENASNPADEDFEKKIDTLGRRIEKIYSEYTELTESEFKQEEEILNLYLQQLSLILKEINAGKLSGKKLMVTTVKTFSNIPVLPYDIFVPGDISETIDIRGCPGEYEPASFVLSAFSDISCLSVEASDLKSGANTIPACNIDLKSVKCWFQAGTAWTDIGQDKNSRILVPDLLLNDDSLVQADLVQQENYLKITNTDGAGRYVWISNPDEKCRYGHPSSSELPVKDARTLQPLNISKNFNKQFWVTVKIPHDAPAGNYEGIIRLKTPKVVLADLKIRLLVFPFRLAPPPYTSSIYYAGKLNPKGSGTLSSELKDEVQLKRDFENMAAHGIRDPLCYQTYDEKLLKKYLEIRKECGLQMSPLYYLEFGLYGELLNFSPEKASLLKKKVREIIEFGRKQGISEFYFYAIDEAKGDKLSAQRTAWDIIHKAGGKIFVAGIKEANFKLVGDLQDLLVCEGELSRGEAAMWHSAGHKIWSYSNPQSGVKNPAVYRENFGIRLWQYDYDGACTFAYQSSMGNIWNDFDHIQYRDHCFSYPTVDGTIDTIAWEAYREAIKDARYLNTLINLTANNSNDPLIAESDRFVKKLKNSDIANENIDTVKDKIIEYILAIQKKREPNHAGKQ